MKKKIFALLTALCMTAAVLPAVFADGEGEATIGMSEQEQCSCIVLCTEDNKNPNCPVCSAEGAELDKVCVGAAPMLPVTALAAGEDAPGTLWVGQTQITASGYWKTTTEGNLITGSENDYNVYYDGNGTLTLNGATIQGGTSTGTVPYGTGIYAQCSNGQSVTLTIKLIGENTITGYYGIYVNAEISANSNGTDASLTITGENNGSLEVSGSNYGIFVKSGTGNASLTINDVSVVAKTTRTSSGYAGVCVQSSTKATGSPQLSLAVNGGSLTTSASEGNDGIQFVVGSHQATGATTSLTVSDNAIVDARTGGISASGVSVNPNVDIGSTGSTGGIVFDGSEGTVYGDVTLQEDLEIGNDETLTIPDGSTLTVPDDKTLTNNGTIIVEKGGNLTGNPGGKVVYAPAITNHPQDVEVKENETANFTVEATGTDLSYQWQKSTDNGSNWTDITGETNTTYTTGKTTMDMSGTQYRCVVENSIDEVTSDAATLTVQQAGVPIPPQPTDPTTPETTAPTDTDHTVQTDNSGHAPVEDNTALPSFWDLVTERINATPRGGEITINMGARAIPDSVLNALRARKLTATFRYGNTELTLTPDQLPPEGMLTEWTLHELGNYVTEADESIRISEEKSEAENATATETTTPAADTGKPNPATGETTTTAAALLVAAVALTGLGVTLKKK